MKAPSIRVGKGTFVAEPKIDQQLRTLTGFTQDVTARGKAGRPAACWRRASCQPRRR